MWNPRRVMKGLLSGNGRHPGRICEFASSRLQILDHVVLLRSVCLSTASALAKGDDHTWIEVAVGPRVEPLAEALLDGIACGRVAERAAAAARLRMCRDGRPSGSPLDGSETVAVAPMKASLLDGC
jgi:hypothetical protein